MQCIKVQRSDSGTYQIVGDTEDWSEVCAATVEQEEMGNLTGWGWRKVFKTKDADGHEGWYFVEEEE